MKKIIAFASLLFISLYTSGQITTATGSSNINDVLFITRSSIKGTPFFKDEWMNGKYVTNNGSFSDNKFLVYNVYTNYLFEKNGSNPQDAIALNSNDISGFVLVDKSQNYIFKKIESDKFLDNNRDTKFYLLIEPTSDKVIIEPNKTFKDPNSSGWTSSSQNNKAGEFKYNESVYIFTSTSKYEKVKNNKSSVLSIFYDKKDQISAFIKEKKLNFKNNKDFILITNYYYSLKK